MPVLKRAWALSMHDKVKMYAYLYVLPKKVSSLQLGFYIRGHHHRFRTGQATEPFLDNGVAVAAPSGFKVEFQIRGASRGQRDGIERRLRERRAAEIGVQHRAGQVEDGA